jgi:hypothetical protein
LAFDDRGVAASGVIGSIGSHRVDLFALRSVQADGAPAQAWEGDYGELFSE